MSQASEAMFTQLTISVQGKKQSGKTRFTDDLLAPLVEAMGGKVIKKNDDKTGVYITVSLPQGSFPAAPKEGEETVFGSLVRLVKGGLVTVGVKVPDSGAITFTPAAPASAALVPLNGAVLDKAGALFCERTALLSEYVLRNHKLPAFVDIEKGRALLLESAAVRIREIDAELAAMGLRVEAEE